MGMDLIPRRKGAESVHYNWSGWRALIDFADENGIDTSTFDGFNNGRAIPAAICREVADAIEHDPLTYNATYGGSPKDQGGYGDDPASEHAKAWRESGGMRQW